MNLQRYSKLLLPMLLSVLAFGQDDAMNRGIALFRQGNLDAALVQFSTARQMQPNNALIENLIGITETRLGRIQQADTDYKKAIQLDPRLEAARKNLGYNYLNAQQYVGAETQLLKAQALDAGDAIVHYYLALVYLKTGRDASAIAQLKPAESLFENDADGAFLMVSACLRANDSDPAIRLTEAVEQRSGFALEKEYALATLFNAKGIHSESIRLFQHMAMAQPQSWVAHYNLAIALFLAGRGREALPVLEPLAARPAPDARIFSLLAYIYESSGDLPAALGAYQKAIAADPDNADNYLDYTRILMDLDRYDDAAALIQKAIQHSEDTYALDVRLGAIDLLKGEDENAKQRFEKAISERPEIAVAYVALAKSYMKEGNDRAAAEVLEGAHNKLAPDFAIEYVYGLVSAQLGNTAKAIASLQNAEKMDPSVVEPHYQLGKLYMDMGDWDRARMELEQVLQLNPSHAQAKYQLSKVYARLGNLDKARAMQADADRLMNTQQQTAWNAQRQRLSAFRAQ